MTRKKLPAGTALAVAPPAPVVLEGEIVDTEETFEPIPYNDTKAIGDEVNRLTRAVDDLEVGQGNVAEDMGGYDSRLAALETRIAELEGKFAGNEDKN